MSESGSRPEGNDAKNALLEIFMQTSENGSTIEPERVGILLTSLNLNLSAIDLENLIIQMKAYDPERSGDITFPMFHRGLSDEIERIAKLSEYKAVFEQLVNPKTGTITAQSLESFFQKKLREDFNSKFYQEMLEGGQEIDYKHFCRMMKKILAQNFEVRTSKSNLKKDSSKISGP